MRYGRVFLVIVSLSCASCAKYRTDRVDISRLEGIYQATGSKSPVQLVVLKKDGASTLTAYALTSIDCAGITKSRFENGGSSSGNVFTSFSLGGLSDVQRTCSVISNATALDNDTISVVSVVNGVSLPAYILTKSDISAALIKIRSVTESSTEFESTYEDCHAIFGDTCSDLHYSKVQK